MDAMLKKPRLSGAAFLEDVREAASSPGLHLWWVGQSGFLLQWQGRHLLLDPYLSDSLTRKYAATEKPHIRMTEQVVDPASLPPLEAVTSSHAHTDHLDPDTLQALARKQTGLRLVCPESIRPIARERSGLPDTQITGLDAQPGQDALHIGDVRITAVPAAHELLDTDTAGRHLYLGYLIQLGPFRVYHSGDTVLYQGMADQLRPFAVDLALLPINGRAPERRVSGNLWGREAAWLTHAIGAGLVIPCHYDMFTFNTATPDEFVRECARLGQHCHVAAQGERVTLDSPRHG